MPPIEVSWRAVASTSGKVKVDAAVHDHESGEELVPRGDEGEQATVTIAGRIAGR